jgi:hypothetical protein
VQLLTVFTCKYDISFSLIVVLFMSLVFITYNAFAYRKVGSATALQYFSSVSGLALVCTDLLSVLYNIPYPYIELLCASFSNGCFSSLHTLPNLNKIDALI